MSKDTLEGSIVLVVALLLLAGVGYWFSIGEMKSRFEYCRDQYISSNSGDSRTEYIRSQSFEECSSIIT